jgi:hypothetical protein
LGKLTHKTRGLETLAILYALPYALLMWSYVHVEISLVRHYAQSLPVLQYAFLPRGVHDRVFLLHQFDDSPLSWRILGCGQPTHPMVYTNILDQRV